MSNRYTPVVAIGALALALSQAPAASPAGADAAPAPKPASMKASELFPDTVIAKGKGVEVKRSQLDEAFVLVKANLASSGQPIAEERRKFVESRLLDKLIATQLLVSKATDADRAKAKETTDKFIAEAKAKVSTQELFNLQLKAMGLSQEQWRDRIFEQAICDEVVQREIRSKIIIADADIQKFYDENPKEFDNPEMVRAAHVLISTKDMNDQTPNIRNKRDLTETERVEKRKLAESIMTRARKGEDFAKLAKEFSDDTGSKEKGGEYTFARGRMVPEFEASAFTLGVNQISEIVTSEYGYHIIKVLEKMPPKKRPLADEKDSIKSFLQQKELQKKLPEYFETMKKNASVEILDASLKITDDPSGDATGKP